LARAQFTLERPLALALTAPPRLTVAVAEDHPVMREGLAALLAGEGGFTVVGSAASARETRSLVERTAPHVLVMDLMLAEDDGLALIKDLAALAPALRLIVFSLHPEDIYAERCLRAGAHGYAMKREPVAPLFRAIRDVAAGGIAVSPRVSAAVLAALRGLAHYLQSTALLLDDTTLGALCTRLTAVAQPDYPESPAELLAAVAAHLDRDPA
jgi:DNA-binding NarL/FixJ family response regulator